MKNTAYIALWFFVSFLTSTHLFADEFAIEDYGLLPNTRNFTLSPDGQHIAYIRRGNNGEHFVINNLATGESVGDFNANKFKARSILFVTDSKVILHGTYATRAYRWRNLYEHGTAMLYDMETKNIKPLLNNLTNIIPAQTGLGTISGFNADKNWLLMSAYVNPSSPRYSLVRVNLENGRSKVLEPGNRYVKDWFTDGQGNVSAHESYNEVTKLHQVHVRDNNKWRLIYEKATDRPSIALSAISRDGSKLVYTQHLQDEEAVFTMNLKDGTIDGPLHVEDNAEINHLITAGLNREFIGLRYTGLMDSSTYLDDNINAQYDAISRSFPKSTISRQSASADGSKSVYLVSGSDAANNYYLLDSKTMGVLFLGSEYANIEQQHIAQVRAFQYKARDGLSISAIITWPVGIEERENLPLIVLPNRGPESYDSVRFDWFAQYLARKGYAVLQPNVRGSSGFGAEFRDAGRGQWGQAVQGDFTDGVTAMVSAGHVDPDRVCIVGSSYGGYSALAGATFTPDVYKCAVSIGGTSDLPRMLKDISLKYGLSNPSVSYWRDVIGDVKNEKEKLNSISPVNFAQQVTAPLLLIHGRDDSVIPIVQSKLMYKALLKAGKDVKLVSLKGEDHWLSKNDTRLLVLKEVTDFLETHNPPDS